MARLATVGQLDARIQIVKRVTKKDANRDTITVDEIIYELFAKPLSQMLSEVKANIGTIQKDTMSFVIRYHQSFKIDTDMTVKYKGKVYKIIKYTPDETDKKWSTIVCEGVK